MPLRSAVASSSLATPLGVLNGTCRRTTMTEVPVFTPGFKQCSYLPNYRTIVGSIQCTPDM
eukprot:6174986-Pleurochrysis_carterae.AAC.3